MKFPALMYVCPGPHNLSKGTYDFIEVRNDKEVEKALDDGFFRTIPEAVEALESSEPEKPRRGRPPKADKNEEAGS